MARPIWSGAVSFGLVNVPVKVFSAVSPKEVRFHMLHEADGARIQFKRVCSVEGEEVPYEDIVKGYEVSRGRYVMLTEEELAALDPKKSRTIDIQDFVDLAEIDPIYYEHTYHLVPEEGAERAYALLRAAMESRGKVAIARMVMRTKEYLCAVRPMGHGLVLSTMNYADEVKSVDEVAELPAARKPGERELKLAEQLIDSLAGPFDPAKYEDRYREEVLELIRRKAKGEEIVTPEEPEAPRVVNLFDALKASLGREKRRAAPRRPRATKPAASGRRGARHKSAA